jgi:uncharacterized protein (TIGR01777 family)
MSKRIIVTGATGLIGSKLVDSLTQRGDELVIFSRKVSEAKVIFPKVKSFVEWNYNKPELWKSSLENSDAVLHLAGINLFSRRWNENFKKEIIDSREISTRNIVEAIKFCTNKPKIFISSSAIGYYGDCGDTILNEASPSGTDFLANVCTVWENESAKVATFGVRSVQIRTGLVLSPEGGALKQMLLPFQLFIGGPLGNGKQWVSWVHMDDIVNIYIHSIDSKVLTGAINAVSPNPVRMRLFSKTLGKVLNRPSLFPVPKFALKLLVGEAAEVITASQYINVKKLIDSGYRFKFEKLDSALKDLLKK